MRCVPALITASDRAKLKLRFPGTEIVLAVIVNSPISARFNSLISSVDCPSVIAVLPKVIFLVLIKPLETEKLFAFRPALEKPVI